MSLNSFTQLRTWQNAKDFAVAIYKTTANFPAEERYGLMSQVRRSAISVSAKIAEGFSRNTSKDKQHFYYIALGSLTESMSHLYVALGLAYITDNDLKRYEAEEEALSKNDLWHDKNYTRKEKVI